MEATFDLHCKPVLEFLRELPDSCVDVIVTDPPYASLEKHRAHGTTTRLTAEWFPVIPNEEFPPIFQEMYRVLKDDAHAYVMSDQESMFAFKPMLEAAGFTFWKGLVWDKMKIGMGYHYRARHEMISFVEKGKRNLNSLSVPDVLQIERIRNGYPTEKPVPLSQVLISQSSEPGDIVLDPFMGSGSCGEAALKIGRCFVGNDIQETAVQKARARLLCAGLERAVSLKGQTRLVL